MIREITTTEYICDGCDKRQVGEIGEDVFGLVGEVEEHDQGGGVSGVGWFACSRECVGKAVSAALDRVYKS